MSNAQTSLSDEALVQRCLAVPRDRAAWDELYRRYESPMLAAAHNALGAAARNQAETDQAVLDVWEYLWEHPGHFDKWDSAQEQLLPFLCNEVRNHVRRLRQKRRRRHEVRLPPLLVDTHTSGQDVVIGIEEVRGCLSPGQRAYADQFLLAAPNPAVPCPLS